MVMGAVICLLVILITLQAEAGAHCVKHRKLVLDRTATALILLFAVFFSANCCGVHQTLPLTGSEHAFVRFLGILLCDVLMAVLLLPARMLVETTFLQLLPLPCPF